jgi:hypothetical protein
MSVHTDFQTMHDSVVSALGVDEVITILENTGAGFTRHPSRAVVKAHKEQDLIAGGSIQQGDLKLIISSRFVPPGLRKLERKDRIEIQGKPHGVIHWDVNTRTVGGLIAIEATVRG